MLVDDRKARGTFRGGQRATMSDVAARVGVSRQLVGLVFRNEAGVGAQTRARILEAARQLGYTPNTAARTLRQASTRSIGVLLNPYDLTPLDILGCIYEHAHADGYSVVVSATTATRNECNAIDELVGHRCEALILIAPHSDSATLRRAAGRTPVVVVGRDMPESDFDTLRSRGDAGMGEIVHHLGALGHRRIAYIHCSDMLDAELRFEGYRKAMESLGLDQTVVEVQGDFAEEGGAKGVEILLQAGDPPMAIMCNNDQAALGAQNRVLQAGFQIPRDISITGYDDNRSASLSYVDLTTVRQDAQEMGKAAVDAATARISGASSGPLRAFTSARMVVRGSTGRPSARPAF